MEQIRALRDDPYKKPLSERKKNELGKCHLCISNAATTGNGLIQFFPEPGSTTFRITGNGDLLDDLGSLLGVRPIAEVCMSTETDVAGDENEESVKHADLPARTARTQLRQVRNIVCSVIPE